MKILLVSITIVFIQIQPKAQPEDPIFSLKNKVGITTSTGYDEVGFKDGTKKIKFYKNGKLKKYINKKWGQVIHEGEYEINSDDQKELRKHYSSSFGYKKVRRINKNGKPQTISNEVIKYDGKGMDLKESIVNYFNPDLTIKKTLFYTGDLSGKPHRTIRDVTYDEKGRVIGYVSEDWYGKISTKHCLVYSWNENGQCTRKTIFSNCDYITSETIYEWQDEGKTMYETINKYIYSQESIPDSKSVPETLLQQKFKYVFDDKQNWIKKFKINEKGKAKLKVKREIQYDL